MTDLRREIEAARGNPARRLDRFLLLGELGRGGMGVVHRAWDARDARVVALKLVLEGADAKALARFEREARSVSALEHPSIVAVRGTGNVNGRPWLAMDLVPGRTLERRLRPGPGEAPLSREEALDAVVQVARAIEHAHERGILHRDLKPGNVMVDDSGRARVLDFGLARNVEARTRLTQTGTTLGTPAYAPPEQVGGEEADVRSDVYGLGALLYFVLAGRPPFEGESELNVITAVLEKQPVPPRRLDPTVPRDLEAIALRCLEKERDRRFATAGQVAEAIERARAGSARRVPWRAAVGLVPVSVVAALGLSLLDRGPRARPAPAPPTPAPPDWVSRAEASAARGDLAGAVSDLDRAIALDPARPEAWKLRGHFRSQLEDHPGALADLDRAVELAPLNAPAWAERAAARLAAGDPAGARADSGKAVELDPTLSFAWHQRAAARLEQGDRDGALSDLDRALALDRDDPALWSLRGGVRGLKEDFPGAIADLDRAIELGSSEAVDFKNRAACKERSGDRRGAAADYARFLELAPDHRDAPAIRKWLASNATR